MLVNTNETVSVGHSLRHHHPRGSQSGSSRADVSETGGFVQNPCWSSLTSPEWRTPWPGPPDHGRWSGAVALPRPSGRPAVGRHPSGDPRGFDSRDAMLQNFPQTLDVWERFRAHMMIVADVADGDPGAIEDALIRAWELQRPAG